MRRFGCPNLSCFSNDPNIHSGDLRSCNFIDCETLSCEGILLGFDNPQPGLMAQISIDAADFVIGLFLVDDLVGDFNCSVAIT